MASNVKCEPAGYNETLTWLEETYTVADFHTGEPVSITDDTTFGKWSIHLKTVFEPIEAETFEKQKKQLKKPLLTIQQLTHTMFMLKMIAYS